MRQFDVLQNPNTATRGYAPYVVVLQSHHLDPLDTVMLASLVNDATRSMSAVDVPVDFQAERFVLVIAEAAGIRRRGLGRTLRSVISYEDAIRRALPRLFTGF